MDINQQLQPIVASLIDSIKASIEDDLRTKLSNEVVSKLASEEFNTIVKGLVTQYIDKNIAQYNFQGVAQAHIDRVVKDLADQLGKTLVVTANNQISTEISRQVASVDVRGVVGSVVESKLVGLVTSGAFPASSIPHGSINFAGFGLSGDNVKGGIIENFGSTGIDDRSTNIQMTLMDHGVAFETALFAPSAAIKGTLTVDGDLIVKGDIPTDSAVFGKLVAYSTEKVRETLNDELFEGFSNKVHAKIRETGIDLDRLTQGGKEILKGNQLGLHITESNLQRLGIVRDLQTVGETLLVDTLYVTSNRVGVNTMDPSATFVVWDEEVEMLVTKRRQDTGYIGTSRNQAVILGSNNKENVVLNTDGSTKIQKLSIGEVPMSSARSVPNTEGALGQIYWNESPQPGAYIGWVCLGSARWAGFGKIE